MNDLDMTLPLKVLFLDVDGVMKPARAWWLKPHEPDGNWDPLSVAAINLIHERTGAHIVFNTAWNSRGYERLRQIAAREGITAPVVGITAFPGLGNRLEAIRLWLADNGPVGAWCALDDEPIGDERCIRVNSEFGISTQNFSDAVRLLGGMDVGATPTTQSPL